MFTWYLILYLGIYHLTLVTPYALFLLLFSYRYKTYLLLLGLGCLSAISHYPATPIFPTQLTGLVSKPLGTKGAILSFAQHEFYLPKGKQYLGCVIDSKGYMRKPHLATNPHTFSERDWLARHQVTQVWETSQITCKQCHLSWLQKLSKSLEHYLDQQPLTHLNEIKALMLGQSGQKLFHWYYFGTIHLLTISGLHINVLLRIIKRISRNHYIAIALVYVYIVFLNFSIPAYRAWLYFLIKALLKRTRYRLTHTDIMLFTAVVMLLQDPYLFYDLGAVYSFSIAWFLRYTKEPIWLSLLLMTTGLSIVYTAPIDLVAIPVNIILLPFFQYYIYPLLLLSLLLPPYTQQCLIWIDHMLSIIDYYSLFAAKISPQVFILGYTKLISLIAYYYLRTYAQYPVYYLGMLFIPSSFGFCPKGEFELTFLQVGHGLSAMIQTKHHTLIYDIGSTRKTDVARSILLPTLYHKGITTVDRVIISHPDWDHYSGLQTVLYYTKVKDLMMVSPLIIDIPWGLTQSRCEKGKTWTWDGVTFTIMHPEKDQLWQNNNQSCVLKVTGSSISALLTGDIEKQVEQSLLTSPIESDILLLPHHGRKTSSSQPFLDKVSAAFKVLSDHQYPPHWQGVADVYLPPIIFNSVKLKKQAITTKDIKKGEKNEEIFGTSKKRV